MTTKDRRPYLTATAISQALLDATASNLTTQIEFVIDITAPDGSIIRASNRNKYIEGVFYRAILSDVPQITKTLGEWLQPGLEFSTISIELLNVDGDFNKFTPGGASYKDWTNNSLIIRVGLFDISASYQTVFNGFVTEVGGFGRTTNTINITARDKYDILNKTFPISSFNNVTYPNIEDSFIGNAIPYILGDHTLSTRIPAQVPAFPVNTADLNVIGGPTGDDDLKRNNIEMVISINDNRTFFSSLVYLKIDDRTFVKVPSSEIVNISAGKNAFEIKQVAATWVPEPDGSGGFIDVQYKFSSGDEFVCKLEGKNLGGAGWDTNIIAMARDILITYTDLTASDFDSTWETFRLKSTPSQSSISTILARIWIQDPISVLEYTLQLLEQVRLEYFIERADQKLSINSLHFEDISTVSSIKLNNWDIGRESLEISTTDTHFINRLQADFDFNPVIDSNNFKTDIYFNSASTSTTKTVSKLITFPNLYIKTDVVNQLTEILRYSSTNFEILTFICNWRPLLQDLGKFILFNIRIGSTQFTDVPCQIREFSYLSNGSIALKVWSYLMIPYPGYNSGAPGIVGGFDAAISKE